MRVHQMQPKKKRLITNGTKPRAGLVDNHIRRRIRAQSVDRFSRRSYALAVSKVEFIVQNSERAQSRAYCLQFAVDAACPTVWGRRHRIRRSRRRFITQVIAELVKPLVVSELRRKVRIRGSDSCCRISRLLQNSCETRFARSQAKHISPQSQGVP